MNFNFFFLYENNKKSLRQIQEYRGFSAEFDSFLLISVPCVVCLYAYHVYVRLNFMVKYLELLYFNNFHAAIRYTLFIHGTLIHISITKSIMLSSSTSLSLNNVN